MQLSSAIVDFYVFYDGPIDMQIKGLLTRSECRASDTRVDVKACWSLVFYWWGLGLQALHFFEC